MSFVEEKGKQSYWECDHCGDRHPLEWDFHSEWSEMKAQGWSAQRCEDGWMHRCGDCAAKAAARLGPILDRKAV